MATTEAAKFGKPDEAIARKVLALVDQGLVRGLGVQEPGKMCVEAAVCAAYGLLHSDTPPCVGSAVRSYKIRLNDASWSSDIVRAQGLRRLAIAQLGSDEIDQVAFAEGVVFEGIKQILPKILRARAEKCPEYTTGLELAAAACELATDSMMARKAVEQATEKDTRAFRYVAAAADYAAAATYAADAAADYAADAYMKDKYLALAAEIGVQVLVRLGAEGTKWLGLCGAAS